MNPEKKLEYFAEAIAKEVEAKKLKARRQMAADMSDAISRAVNEAEAEAGQHILNEKQAIQKAENKRLSEAKAKARRALISLREELTAKLTQDVKADIADFTQSGEYESYLVNSIQVTVAKSMHSFIYIQLTPSDLHLSSIVQESTGLIPEQGDESGMGGYKLLSANRGMAVDCTFKSRLESAMEEFNATIASSSRA